MPPLPIRFHPKAVQDAASRWFQGAKSENIALRNEAQRAGRQSAKDSASSAMSPQGQTDTSPQWQRDFEDAFTGLEIMP
jgi:hypothetical protein